MTDEPRAPATVDVTMLQRSIDELLENDTTVAWSVSVRDSSGRELAGHDAGRVLQTASVGKLLLLVEVARQRATGDLDGSTVLRRASGLAVADSGLWQHLEVEQLSIDDVCVLVASVSDNLATNVLLNHVGLQSVQALAASIGLVHTTLLDVVRDQRGMNDPPGLSVGSAGELSRLLCQLSRNEMISQGVSERVNAWLATGVDTSMIGSALGVDPLAHVGQDRKMFLRNKTGSDPGVRADVGTMGACGTELSYAVIANWETSRFDRRDSALSRMRDIGALLRAVVE